MSIGFRSSSNSGGNVAAATVTVTLPAGTLATDIVVVNFSYAKNNTGGLGSWTAPAGWTAISQPMTPMDNANAPASCSVQAWWALGNVVNLTWTQVGTVNFLGWEAASFTGVDNTTPIDAFGAGNGNISLGSLLVNAVTVVTTGAWELIASFDWNGGIQTATGFTVLSNYVSRLLYNTTPLPTGSTGPVTLNTTGGNIVETLVAQPFALRPFVIPSQSPTRGLIIRGADRSSIIRGSDRSSIIRGPDRSSIVRGN